MKKLLLAFALWMLPSLALAQNPTCPTRPVNDNSNACASTAYVANQITSQAPVQSVFGRTGAVVAVANDYNFNQIAGQVALSSQISGFGTGTLAALEQGANTATGFLTPNGLSSGTCASGLGLNASSVPILITCPSASAITVGSTGVSGGSNGAFLWDNSGVLGATLVANGDFAVGSSSGPADSGYNPATLHPNWLSGLILSNDGTSPNTVLDIEAGLATDSTNTDLINIGTFKKSTAGSWASGSGSNGMGNGLTIANNTWYSVCLAYNAGTPDIYFDTSVTCANKPSGISGTAYRLIGFFKTNSSAQIITFTQTGDEFDWSTIVEDQTATTGSTSTANLALASVPNGVIVNALIGLFMPTGSNNALVLPGGMTGVSVTTANANMYQSGNFNMKTDTAQHVAVGQSSAGTIDIFTRGYIFTRGKLN